MRYINLHFIYFYLLTYTLSLSRNSSVSGESNVNTNQQMASQLGR